MTIAKFSCTNAEKDNGQQNVVVWWKEIILFDDQVVASYKVIFLKVSETCACLCMLS